MEKIYSQFQLDGLVISCTRYGSGHINETYLVVTSRPHLYILQKLSTQAFKNVPGLMGTLFSFVDKIISSLAPMIAGLVFTAVGFADHNPVEGDPVTMKLRIGVAFLAYGLIILGLICNLIAMKFYPLTKEKMAEIQEKVAAIKAAAANEA